MKEEDFKICKYIRENMHFNTFNDFFFKSERIRNLYQDLELNERTFYKWYVYANVFMNEFYKNIVWDYLNGYAEKVDLLKVLARYKVR